MLKELLKLDDLEGFVIKEFIEVYRVNEDGSQGKSHGAFYDDIYAAGYVDIQPDADNLHIRKIFVLYHKGSARIDDIPGLIIADKTTVINDEEYVANTIFQAALAKLTAPEIAIIKARICDL